MSRRLVVTASLLLLCLTACGGGDDSSGGGGTTTPQGRPTLATTYRPTGRGAAGDVFVHLFEWRWTDIASECENVLGPAGYKAVQVSPPQEHAIIGGNPWWERYQPVSYSIDNSRSGTRAEFTSMVQRCKAAGVDIYVDAVFNHMSGGSGVGSNGTQYTKYSYPGLYTQADFHTPCAVNDYQTPRNVQDCELVGLPDLDTGSPSVRGKIAGYLIELARLGVAGFRIDAAKHIQPVELDSIVSRVNAALVAEGKERPYWFGEVIDYGGEGVTTRDYFGLGYASGGASDITEFKVRGVGDKFMGNGGQYIAQLDPNGPQGAQFSEQAWGIMPSDKAVVFLENHDTQRTTDNVVSYRSPAALRLGYVWLLAQPYGYPSVMSSYAFDRTTQAGRDMGPPSDGTGRTNSVSCAASLEAVTAGSWVCEHRDPVVRRMVAFRKYVAGTPVASWWSQGQSAIAFSRGDKGFVAINRGGTSLAATIPTPLAAGTYCDLLTGGRVGSACAGTSVVVSNGTASVTLGSDAAVALTAAAKL